MSQSAQLFHNHSPNQISTPISTVRIDAPAAHSQQLSQFINSSLALTQLPDCSSCHAGLSSFYPRTDLLLPTQFVPGSACLPFPGQFARF